MLFRKKIEPQCGYCLHGKKVSERDVACVKKGIMPLEGSCRKFQYDPVKRVPPRPATLNTKRLREEDFSLD